MNHESEFSDTVRRDAEETKRRAMADSTAKAYARLFLTDDGKVVLEDLHRKFGHARPRFDVRDRNHSTVTAALIDGQCWVLREIEQAIRAGGGTL
jgi:beta-lactamase class D